MYGYDEQSMNTVHSLNDKVAMNPIWKKRTVEAARCRSYINMDINKLEPRHEEPEITILNDIFGERNSVEKGFG